MRDVITLGGVLVLALSFKSEEERLNQLAISEGAYPVVEEDQMSVVNVEEAIEVIEKVVVGDGDYKDPWSEYAESLHDEKDEVGLDLSGRERAFYQRFYPTAMMEQRRYKIPFSISMSQGALESNWGRSTIAINANNYFGIKTKGTGYRHQDDTADDKFRIYDTAWESWRAHSKFLHDNPRYAALFKDEFNRADWNKHRNNQKCLRKGPRGCVTGKDPRFDQKLSNLQKYWDVPYKRWAIGLSILNYATDVNYDTSLIKMIEDRNWHESDI